MKTFFLSTCLLLATVCMFAQQKINDPNAETRDVKGFNAIHVSSSFDVYLTQSNDEAVAVSASEEKYKANIVTEVKNGELYIRYEHKGLRWSDGKMKLKAYISFKSIKELSLSGASDLYVIGSIKADDLKIDLSGASDWKEGKVEVSKLKIELSGASDMKITGTANELDVDANGASDFKGFDLTTETCDARASGASSISITVNKELSAHASGASDVHYKGEGMIKDIKTSGASSISRRS
jgi:hypothetical protein